MRDAVLRRGLRSRHLVVALENQVVPLDGEERVGAPLVLVRQAAAGLATSTPLVREQNLRAVIAEGRRVP